MQTLIQLIDTYPAVLALAIFCARIVDVSLGTIRILVGFRGYRLLAALIGFCEAAIWVIAASKVIGHLDYWYLVIAYAAGYATGNFVGITLERRLGVGRELVRIISYCSACNLADALTRRGYSVVELAGRHRGEASVQVLYVVDKRRRMPELLRLVHELDPAAIYTVTDVKSCHGEDVHALDAAAGPGLALRFKRK
ncbi:uncharacterized protein YebE (UPF0316 family) [Tahibacter aquaticus]|uniref:Uncharacterized protein YebE (UPF0316 family) n=1 Tax=Tahibacter aquaticus TaxID=520092 RepID=A0A4R6YSQ1_9GAMM|nr:DUF5698 domain-containing protein [Tahibacter aquaticus]TDR41291.1 uncharacterized protein YebE (UPF0316 family) [Tahibacter aquaticus]